MVGPVKLFELSAVARYSGNHMHSNAFKKNGPPDNIYQVCEVVKVAYTFFEQT